VTIAWKVRTFTAAFVLILAGAVTFHLHAVRQSVRDGRAVAATAERQRLSVLSQTERVDAMQTAARKYLVSRDGRYLDRLADAAGDFGLEARSRHAGQPTDAERRAAAIVVARWEVAEAAIRRLTMVGAPEAMSPPNAPSLEPLLDATGEAVRALGRELDVTLNSALARSEQWAVLSERVSWLVLGTAAVLLALLSLAVERWLVAPLRALAQGTRDIGRGRFATIQVRSDDEVGVVSREFNAMSSRLAQVDALKRDFLSNVSHDLKTPLSSMQETTDALLDGLAGPLTDKQRQLLRLNQESGSRLASMIAKLLDLSRAEARTAVERDLLDLSALARRAVDHVNSRRSGRAGAVRATLVGADPPILLRADAEGIAQVLDNLLENADKFSPPGGSVVVRLADHDGLAVLAIADQGPGVPVEERERIFERFYQTAAGRAARSRGVGLGLAICRQIVESHGGTIRVVPNLPAGAVFEAMLPGAISLGGDRDDEPALTEALT
jgi:signal transduction histidine kinase